MTYQFDDDYEDFFDEPDVCDCDDYDVDLIEGRAWCPRCGRRWWLTNEQISREIAHQAAYLECVEAEADTQGGAA